MKKLLILALVALVAGSVFATTDPAFSGDFEYTTMMDFDAKEYVADDNDGEAAVNLNGVVDEWSTVNAEFKADAGDPITLNSFTLTTDVTGALGVDGPVGVSITWGALTYEAEEYQGKAGYEDASFTKETVSVIGFKLAFSIGDNVKVITLIAPGTYINEANWTVLPAGSPTEHVGAVEVQFLGLVEGLDANVFFVYDPNVPTDPTDLVGMEMGATAGYSMGALDLGLIALYRDRDVLIKGFGFGVSGAYTLADILKVGVAFSTGLVDQFVDTSGIGVNATWYAADVLDVFGAVAIPFASGAKVGFDAGIIFKLGATSYTFGYAMNGSEFQSPGTTSTGTGAFLKVKASF